MIHPNAGVPPPLFLHATAAINGAAVLVLQIVGGRLLAPYLGSSHYVWTAQILTTLIALAIGYLLGGWLTDRRTPLSWLFWMTLAAAGYLMGIISFVERIAFASLQWSLPVGALASAMALFFIPLLLLAITAPFLLKALPIHAGNVGSQVGILSAISTAGSVAGALVAGLWLIPSFQNASSLHATAAALCALSGLYFIVWGRRWAVRIAAAATAVAICIGGNHAIKPLTRGVYEQWTELERRNSPFGLMQILQSKITPQRALINDFLMQNSYDPQTRHSLLAFSYMEHGLARAYHTNANSVLVIGMGVGIVPGAFAEEGARVDTVEINPAYVDLGVKYFDLDTNKFRIFIEDGRYFMRRSQSRYDLVIMDAFLGDSPPSHLMTRESFESARQLLNSDGLFVMNSFGDFDLAPDPFFLASMHKTLAAVFRTVKIHSTGNGNVFFVASMRETLEMQQRPSLRKVHATKVPEVRKGYANMITTDPAHGMVLTDDYNPVDVRDARNRERIRRAMAEAVRKF